MINPRIQCRHPPWMTIQRIGEDFKKMSYEVSVLHVFFNSIDPIEDLLELPIYFAH